VASFLSPHFFEKTRKDLSSSKRRREGRKRKALMEASDALAPGQPMAAEAGAGAVVAAPGPSTAPDGAVDMNVHPSGIVPILQCVPKRAPPPLCFFLFTPSNLGFALFFVA
jgi:hypothetical protein